MEEKRSTNFTGTLSQYLAVQKEIIRIKIARQISESGSSVAAIIIIGGITAMGFLITTFGLALYISAKLNSYWQGFLITGAAIFLLVLIIASIRKLIIIDPIRGKILSALLEAQKKPDEE